MDAALLPLESLLEWWNYLITSLPFAQILYCRPPCQESTFTSQIKQIVWPPEDHLPGFLQRLNKSSALYQDLLFQYPADPQMWWMIVEGLNISAIHKNDYIKKNVGIVKVSIFQWPCLCSYPNVLNVTCPVKAKFIPMEITQCSS